MKNERSDRLPSRHYLLSVIGLSSIPRLVTSLLSVISFPIVLRMVGATEYGVFIYVSAMLNLTVLLADAGVAAASGKAIAEARVRGGNAARTELRRCARLQGLVGAVGLVPMIGISWIVASASETMTITPAFLFMMAFATWLSVGIAFVRSCLQSYLAFGWLAVLDTVESTIRTATWLVAAWLLPTTMGLAWATLITAVVAGLLGVAMLLVRARRGLVANDPDPVGAYNGSPNRLLHDSAKFFGIGLATRVFLSAPLIMFGQLLGAEVVGVIGAFMRLLEMLSFPFITIGNALAVRAYEVKEAGISTIVALWDASFRFIVLAVGAAGAVFLSAELLARAIIPETEAAPALFAMLSIMVLTHSTSSFISPMADFVGGLKRRMIFLGVLSVIQLPVLAWAATVWGDYGAVIGYSAGNLIMLIGYVWIGKRAFFGALHYFPPPYIKKSLLIVVSCVAVTAVATRNVYPSIEVLPSRSLFALSLYTCLLTMAFLAIRELRERFLNLSLFEFTGT